MTDSSQEGRQSDIATQEAKKISKSPFHLGGKSTARMNNRVTTCELKMTEPSGCFECFFSLFRVENSHDIRLKTL